jgi:DNA-binding MarR family transcriptional regulator
MTESRIVRDPFLGKDVQISNRLTDRLRGRYANGPTMPNGEPEFGWRHFDTPPIQHEAADEIDRLNKLVAELRDGRTHAASQPVGETVDLPSAEQRAILAILSRGEASSKEICVGMGLPWPAKLETARYHINRLVRMKLVEKARPPASERTRQSYYALAPGRTFG